MNWYILKCVGGREKAAKKELELSIQENNLANEITEVIVPEETTRYIDKNNKTVEKSKILISGYIILKMNWKNPSVQKIIQNNKKVLGFLGTNKYQAVPSTEEEVNKLLGINTKNDSSIIEKGTTVKIIEGPFKGSECVVDEVISSDKLRVIKNIFGRETKLDIDKSEVSLI